MLKLIKYELLGRYKAYIIAYVLTLFLNIYFFFKLTTNGISEAHYIELAIFSLVSIFVAGIIALITGISLCKRDIYGDTGYLMFSLPIRGYAIVGYKLIYSFMELIIFSFIPLILALVYYSQFSEGTKIQVSYALNGSIPIAIYIIIGMIITFAFLILLAHFSLAISKTAIANKKYGKLLSFVIFFVALWGFGKISSFLGEIFPYSINTSVISNSSNIKFEHGTGNIAVMIFNFVICVILFIATSYIIEKKLDS